MTDEMCELLTRFLGGDALARRSARALYLEDITTVEELREQYDRPVPPGYERGWALADVRNLGPKGLQRIGERLDRQP